MPSARILLAFATALVACPATADMRVVFDTSVYGGPFTSAALDPVARKAFVADPAGLKVVDLDVPVVRSLADVGARSHATAIDAARGLLYLAWSDWFGDGVTVVDTRTEREVAYFGFRDLLASIAADFGRSELYLGLASEPSVVVASTASQRATGAIPVGYNVSGVAVDRVRGRLVAGRWQYGSRPVAILDTATRTVVASPLVPDSGGDCSFSDCQGPHLPVADERRGHYYVVHGSGMITVIDAGDLSARTIGSPGSGSFVPERVALSPARGKLYLADEFVGSPAALHAVDAATGSVVSAPSPAPNATGSRTLVVDDDGGDLYLTIGGSVGRLYRIDPATLAVREVLNIPGLNATTSLRDPVTGRLVLVGGRRIAIVETSGSRAGTRIAWSFRHKAFGHYFATSDATERRMIDDGRFGDEWVPSEDVFRVWTEPFEETVAMCRFFSTSFAPKSSHFYTPYEEECARLRAGGDWTFEGIAFHVALPDTRGECPPGTEALYRLYNQGQGGAPNHRYTPSRATRETMQQQGWIAEGSGPDTVFACTPSLR